jgi:hypothetical protein
MKNLTPQNEQDILTLVKTHMDDTVGLENLSVLLAHGQSIRVRSTRKMPPKDKVGMFGFSSVEQWKAECIQEWQYDVDDLIDKLDQELGIDFELDSVGPSGFALITV